MSASTTKFFKLRSALALSSFLISACATTKPCTRGGDFSLPGIAPVKGDRHCYTKTMPDGRDVLHGAFKQLRLDGKVAFEGAFDEGLKTGIWTIYNEKGEIISEKYFERGIERSYKMPQPTESPPPVRRR